MESTCPMQKVQKLLSGKWKFEIIFRISQEEIGFNDLNKKIHWISEATLNRVLKELLQDEIIIKDIISKKPVRVKYRLSSKGESLRPILLSLLNWVHEDYDIFLDQKLIDQLEKK